MISFLRGVVASKTDSQLVLDVNGVGYLLKMSSIALSEVGTVGSEATILTYMQVKEDGISLFGFLSEDERFVFEKFITVSGVGPKAALAALSTYECKRLMCILGSGDSVALAKVSGIGKKIAQRITVDLSSAFDGYSKEDVQDASLADQDISLLNCRQEATEALLSMGFIQEECELALKGYTGNNDAGELIKYALRRLGNL